MGGGVQDEVLRIAKKLDKLSADSAAANHASACDLLKALKSLPITLEVLQKTRIGVTVNNFRKVTKDEEAISLSKAIIKSWKKLVPESGGSHSDAPGHRSARSSSAASTSSDRRASQQSSDSPPQLVSQPSSDSPPQATASQQSSDSPPQARASTQRSDSMQSNESEGEVGGGRRDSGGGEERRESFTDDSGLPLSPTAGLPSIEVDDTKDPIRVKCRDMLSAALRTQPSVEGGGDCDILAAEIEHFVFKQFDNTEMKYKNRIRSRITNLKDNKNPRLRENVLLGHISPKQFSMMSPEEMASDEMKKLREKLSAEAFNDHQMSTNSGTKSDLFKCGRCGKRNTTYNQLQTRSSDEPMTTFVFCNECGYRWKFC